MAAVAYKLLAGRDVSTVFILAPSHYAAFSGAYVSTADAYRTPLGLVPISPKAAALAKTSPFDGQGPYGVQRPPWWRQSPQTAPPVGQDKPDTWEHAGEVQVPFLQKVLKNFDIVPIVFGRVDPVEVAKAIEPLLDDKTVIVASSDLSHYHPYDEAKALDERCLQAVCTLNIDEMKGQEACGEAPILTVLHLALKKGWQGHLLGYYNSGNVTGNKGAVVGYGAVAFCEVTKASANEFSPQERKQLLDLARNALRQAVADGKLPQIEESTLPKKFAAAKGCFVTLTENGSLRGCIGNLTPQFPLYKAVRRTQETPPSTTPVSCRCSSGEVDRIEIEISVLTEPRAATVRIWRELLDRLHPHTDGVILKIGSRMAHLPAAGLGADRRQGGLYELPGTEGRLRQRRVENPADGCLHLPRRGLQGIGEVTGWPARTPLLN